MKTKTDGGCSRSHQVSPSCARRTEKRISRDTNMDEALRLESRMANKIVDKNTRLHKNNGAKAVLINSYSAKIKRDIWNGLFG